MMRGVVDREKGRKCIDSDMTCMPYRRQRENGLNTMILWRIVEILGGLIWSQSGRSGDAVEWALLSLHRFRLEEDQILEKRTFDSYSQANAGFRNIMKVDWKSTLGSLLSILSHRVPMSLSFSLSQPSPLAFFN